MMPSVTDILKAVIRLKDKSLLMDILLVKIKFRVNVFNLG